MLHGIKQALNSGVDKDVKINPEEFKDLGEVNQASRGWMHYLLFGAIAGMAVGILNLVAYANAWSLNEYFEFLDQPIDLLKDAINEKFEVIGWDDPGGTPASWVPIFVYWMIVGLFLAPFFRFARDRPSRYALFLGIGGGTLIGALDAMARIKEWEVLSDCFDILDRPVISLVYEHGVLYSASFYMLGFFYWMIIGLILAVLFCLFRVFKTRKRTAEYA